MVAYVCSSHHHIWGDQGPAAVVVLVVAGLKITRDILEESKERELARRRHCGQANRASGSYKDCTVSEHWLGPPS